MIMGHYNAVHCIIACNFNNMPLFSFAPLVGTPVHPVRSQTPAPGSTPAWDRAQPSSHAPVLAFPAVGVEPVAELGGCGVRGGHRDRSEQVGAVAVLGRSPNAVLLEVLGHVEHRD